MSFSNKLCVITGGVNGIGRCMTEEFLKAGAYVAVIDRDKKAGENLVRELGSDKVYFYCGDIADETVLNSFANNVINRFGHIDILINNACLSKSGIISGCSYEDFNYVLRVGVTAPYFLALKFKDYFSQGASIVNISSTRAGMSQPDTESYTAVKGGISALTHALAVSLSGRVRVNSISPGWIDTAGQSELSEADLSQHPAGRVGRSLDIVKTAMFLCSEDASFITGENITVDGGMTKLMIYHNDNGWNYNK